MPSEVKEVACLGLATSPSALARPPRLQAAPVALECRLNREIELSSASTLVMLDVLRTHASEVIWDEASDCADASRWSPVMRLASVSGPNYGVMGETLRLGAPKLP